MTEITSFFGAARLPRAILFGRGQRGAIGSTSARIGRRALIVTDERQAAQPEFAAIMADLAAHGVETQVFDRVIPDLPVSAIDACVAPARAFGPDVVIAIGGGSAMDHAKVAAVLLTHGGEVSDYYGEFAVPGPVLPLIAVPTTAGTGSEVTPVAVVSDEARRTKIGIASPYLIPQVAICDPELTATCPPGLTAVSGADALTHAIESFTTAPRAGDAMLTEEHVFVGKNVLSDHFARLAVANLFKYLERAWRDGSDMEAREGVMLASLTAGCAFGTAGTAAAHALQYPIGNLTHTPHGAGVAALMPFVMQYNRPACAEAFAELATLIGLPDGSVEQRSQAFIEAVADLMGAIRIPASLAELGLAEDQQEYVAEHSLNAARLIKNNPRPLDLDAMRAITRAAYAGEREQLIAI
ncbi:iron-containing alcohol dehydrogenase [Sphingomonas sp.]|uniref:iron-containing alcohol dehydrogenase n=1 Tax=Sphingomonas sp. TaxID=28214 RepID=UPI002C594B6F|nr:iron-containing alcohol dehydrogenase [Sphingomonas sp.]HTG39182.1 iron-containing alcohol dehydrogenase [Sphingomonas sp.]